MIDFINSFEFWSLIDAFSLFSPARLATSDKENYFAGSVGTISLNFRVATTGHEHQRIDRDHFFSHNGKDARAADCDPLLSIAIAAVIFELHSSRAESFFSEADQKYSLNTL